MQKIQVCRMLCIALSATKPSALRYAHEGAHAVGWCRTIFGEINFCNDGCDHLAGCWNIVDAIFLRIGVRRYYLHVATSESDQWARSYSLSKLGGFREIPEIWGSGTRNPKKSS